MDRSEAQRLLDERSRLRAARDFEAADRLRAELQRGGWDVEDSAAGSTLKEAPVGLPEEEGPPPEPREVTLLTLVHGWPEDVTRWAASIERNPPVPDWEVLLVDNSGDPDLRSHLRDLAAKDRFRLLVLQPAAGWAEAANRGLEASAGRIVVLFDPGTELEGPIDPLFEALDDEGIAVAGPYGVRAEHSLHHFHDASSEPVHAIEGYCLALRRDEALEAGGFDRKFRFYRIADFELCFRLRAEGARRAQVVDVPVRKHAHRLWEATEPAERDRLSKRNFYRLLDRWRDRPDLYQE